MDWIDISVPLKAGMMHWPGDPEVQIERICDMENGDKNTLSVISMGTHSGTHIDAPLHFLRGSSTIDHLPLDVVIGTCRIIEIADAESVKVPELQRHDIRHGERILFKTKNSSRSWHDATFMEDFVYISTDAAAYLADIGVILIGIDYLSVGGYKKNGTEVHRILLGAGIWIIEGLNMSGVGAGEYELACLPLNIRNAEGAPARAVVRPVSES